VNPLDPRPQQRDSLAEANPSDEETARFVTLQVCDPTADRDNFAKKVADVDVGLVGGTIDLAAGLATR
jgi:hypothetical protein